MYLGVLTDSGCHPSQQSLISMSAWIQVRPALLTRMSSANKALDCKAYLLRMWPSPSSAMSPVVVTMSSALQLMNRFTDARLQTTRSFLWTVASRLLPVRYYGLRPVTSASLGFGKVLIISISFRNGG